MKLPTVDNAFLAQLIFADTIGIGFSGIGYALFGLLFVKGKATEEYKNFLDRKAINAG